MNGFRHFAALALVVALGYLVPAQLGAEETSSPPAPAQTDAAVMQRLAELEKEVERLRGELQAVKTAPAGAATLRPAVYALPDGTPAAAAAPAAAPAQAARPRLRPRSLILWPAWPAY